MPFITYSVYGQDVSRLDVGMVLDSLVKDFPGTRIHQGDQLRARAERARDITKDMPPDKSDLIIRTLQRNADQYGPAYSFEIDAGVSKITGTVRPIDLTFIGDASAAKTDEWARLKVFAAGLGRGSLSIGEVRQDTDE